MLHCKSQRGKLAMNRYVKLSVALLAGMLVSGVAMGAEKHKYFECTVTRQIDWIYPDIGHTAAGQEEKVICSPEAQHKCGEVKRFNFDDFKKIHDEYTMEGDDISRVRIDRTSGKFVEDKWFPSQIHGRDVNAMTHRWEGACELKTEKLMY